MPTINFVDDLINPPELGILEKEIKRVPHGQALVLPMTEHTRGDGPIQWRLCGRSIWHSCLGLPPTKVLNLKGGCKEVKFRGEPSMFEAYH